jgi:hypothetical protein
MLQACRIPRKLRDTAMETDVETQDGMKRIHLSKSASKMTEEAERETDADLVKGLAQFADKEEYVDEL